MKFYGDYQVYSESGVDLTLLRENLKRSIETRIAQNAGLIELANALVRSRPVSAPSVSKDVKDPIVEDFNAPGILRLLKNGQVDFVLIGGFAMIANGSTYVTKDVDVCYSRVPRNIDALVQAIGSIHPYLRGAPRGLPFQLDRPTIQAGLNFTLTTDLGDVDLLGEVSGLGDYDKVVAQSDERLVFDMPIRVLSLDGLIAAKKAAGRGKDRQHLLELEELKKMRDAQPRGASE